MRLIDVDALMVVLEKIPAVGFKNIDNQTYTLVLLAQVLNIIKQQPTIEERKTGKWIETDSHEPCWYKCDQCGRLSDIKEIYCPTCGASMVNTTCRADMRGGNEQ